MMLTNIERQNLQAMTEKQSVETKSISDLARQHGIKKSTLHMRMKRGMPLDEALKKPVMTTIERCTKAGAISAEKRKRG